jgi:hypothetical protein
MKDVQEELQSARQKLTEAQGIELDLRRKQRELEQSKEELQLEVGRRVEQELERIRAGQTRKEATLAAKAKELNEAIEQLEIRLAERIESEREKIEEEAKSRAETAMLLELMDLRAQNEELGGALKSAQKMELELRQSKGIRGKSRKHGAGCSS